MTNEVKDLERKTYELQSICFWVRPHIRVDTAIYHPFRYHHEPILSHRHTEQWQHVRMTKTLPGHNLPTEPLYGHGQFVNTHTSRTTHLSNLLKVTRQVYPQDLDRYLLTIILGLPHIRKTATTLRGPRWAVTEWNCQ